MSEALDLAFDPNDSAPEVKIPSREGNVLRTPDAANPLICKILPNPLRNKEVYYEVELIKHMIGPDPKKDTRYHLSRKMLGEKSPEVERYWDVFNQLKKLKEQGKEGSDEWKKLDNQKQTFNVSKRFLLLVLPQGETKPKALEVTWRAVKKLFGAPARGKDPAFVGLVDQMRAKGRDPLSLKSETGWVKLWRTGTGLETEWHVQEATVEVKVDGEDVVKPLKVTVNPAVYKLTKADLIDLTKVHMTDDKLWTEEECQKFVDSFGTWIPERCKRKSGGMYQGQSAYDTKAPSRNQDAPTGGNSDPEDEPFDLNNVF